MDDATEQPLACLTQSEREVLELIARGYTIREIAHELSRSHETIATHRARIGKKLGGVRLARLVRIALRAGLAPLGDDDLPPTGA